MVREESLKQGLLTRNIENMIRRTPPHLLNQQNRKHKHPNMSDSTPIRQKNGGSSMNPTHAISGKYNQLGLLPTSPGDLCSLLQSKTAYTGVVPQVPELVSTTPKTSATSGSPYKEVTPRAANHNPSEPMRLLLGGRKPGGSNSRTLIDYQLPHQLPSFHHGVPDTNGNSDRNHPHQYQQLAQHHCNQTGRNEQLPLPSHRSSHHTSNSNIHHTSSRTRATSSAVLGKCPAVSNPAQSLFPPPPSILGKRPTTSNPSQSFFQPPPSVLGKRPTTSNPARSFFQPPPSVLGKRPSNAVGMEPWCKLETDELLSLVLSMGTPEFLAMSEKVLRSGSSLHDPPRAGSDHITVGGTRAASAPDLLLGLGNGSGMDEGKGKGVSSYWDLDDMVEMMESVKRKRKETGQPVPDFSWSSALDFDGPCSSKNKRN